MSPESRMTLAFDVYGTLVDTAGIAQALAGYVGDLAPSLAQLWRDKQLEYSFRRGLMQRYADFAVCTRDALDYACASLGADLTGTEKGALLQAYRALPAFADVEQGLQAVKTLGCRLFAFSNGTPDEVDALLKHANLRHHFEAIVSVDEVGSFKPDPAVYARLLQRTNSAAAETWLVSGNPFDVIGAIAAGLQAVWLKRDPQAVFDPWEIQPSATISRLDELPLVLPGVS
ncbi:MAG: haloacid dehalogenase type II [Proteobacteria bacterium]|nr:haloacid dehalogenase type II [Pseudomonadota bacterium]